MNICDQFLGLSVCNTELYDDEYIEGLLDEGAKYFDRDVIPETSYADKFFPMGKPAIPTGKTNCIDAEVGDDLIAISNNWRYLSKRISVLRDYLDLKISEKDTSLNDGIGNYSEALVRIPRTYGETWLSQKSIHRGEEMGYIDVPKIRLMIPTRNMRQTWSSTDIGKFTDLGKTQEWTPRGTPFLATAIIGSLIQDATLGVLSKAHCAYMPTDFGGAGKPIPFNRWSNFKTFLSTWKNGSMEPLISTAIKQANRFLRAASTMGTTPSVPVILDHFTKCEPVFHDWIKDDRSISALRAPIPSDYDQYSAGTLRYGDTLYWVLPRLLHGGVLVTETSLQVALQHNALSNALVSADTYSHFKEKMTEARKTWSTRNDISQIPVGILQQEISLLGGNNGVTEMDLERFFKSAKEVLGFRRLIQSERIYWPQALHGAYRSGPMLLKAMALSPNIGAGGGQIHNMVPRDRDSPETSEEIEGRHALTEWVKNPQGEPPQSHLDDDAIIMRKVLSLHGEHNVCLVTDDTNLCRRVGATGVLCLRIPVHYYYRMQYFCEPDAMEQAIENVNKHIRTTRPWTTMMDTGSIQSGEERFFTDGTMYQTARRSAALNYSGPWSSRPHVVHDDRVEIDYDNVALPPINWPASYIFGPRSRRPNTDFTRG